ncbi:hypothetical protein [Gracilimonas sediminicola]|uniref:hypothetical protein n=1 Tax=Gracilimonas sediminicola TaxID=2952158 RepID=UPI0038D3A795
MTNPSFVLPAKKNRITSNDIEKGYLRITVDFKQFFPDSSQDVSVFIDQSWRTVRFTYRENRSHLLHIGQTGMDELDLSANDQVRIDVVGSSEYRISKITS